METSDAWCKGKLDDATRRLVVAEKERDAAVGFADTLKGKLENAKKDKLLAQQREEAWRSRLVR